MQAVQVARRIGVLSACAVKYYWLYWWLS